jgi:hypothetical protein
MSDKLVKLLSCLMPAVSAAERPWSAYWLSLFKIIVLKKNSAPFAERYITEIKKENVATKKSPQKAAETSQNGFLKSTK